MWFVITTSHCPDDGRCMTINIITSYSLSEQKRITVSTVSITLTNNTIPMSALLCKRGFSWQNLNKIVDMLHCNRGTIPVMLSEIVGMWVGDSSGFIQKACREYLDGSDCWMHVKGIHVLYMLYTDMKTVNLYATLTCLWGHFWTFCWDPCARSRNTIFCRFNPCSWFK